MAPAAEGVVIRHSKHPSGTITFPDSAWRAFAHDARDGVANTNGVVTITKIGTDTLVRSLHTPVALRFDAEEWSAFLAGAADGEFDFTGQLASAQSSAALVEPTSRPYPWWGDGSAIGPKNGGYATTLPSKFISADGRQMWMQCNWFTGLGGGSDNYKFSLRPLTVSPYQAGTPSNPGNPAVNLARAGDAVPIDKTSHYGKLAYLNDGNPSASEDSWDGSPKDADRWGITWSRPYNFDRVVYTTGAMFPDGGWFASGLTVQVRNNFVWTTVTGLAVNPAYPYDANAGPSRRFTLTFANTSGDGVRIVGSPGGSAHFTSISELEVYFDG